MSNRAVLPRLLLGLRLAACAALGLAGLAFGLPDRLVGRAAAEPLARGRNAIEDLQQILKQDYYPPETVAEEVDLLVGYRKKLDGAIDKLHSLGDMSRALLLPEWGGFEPLDIEVVLEEDRPPIPQEKIDEIADQRDLGRFEKQLTDELERERKAAKKDTRTRGGRFFFTAIGRAEQRHLLQRFREGLRGYLLNGTTGQQVAAANLVATTMTKARSTEAEPSLFAGTEELADKGGRPKKPVKGPVKPVPKGPEPPQARRVRNALRGGLLDDLERLARDQQADPQVQAAAARALGALEADPDRVVRELTELLKPSRNVLVRRAAAEALGEIVESAKANRGTPGALLAVMKPVFPAAAVGLKDEDRGVRRASLDACRRIVDQVEERVTPPPLILATAEERVQWLRQLAAELPRHEEVGVMIAEHLPALNQAAQDPDENLRVEVCHILEKYAAIETLLRRLRRDVKGNRRGSEPPETLPQPKSGAWRPAEGEPSRWAAARLPTWPAVVEPAERTVSLGAPSTVPPAPPALAQPPGGSALRPTAFLAQPEVVPAKPKKVEGPDRFDVPLKGTVEAMIERLRDPDYRVRLAAVDVLESLGDRATPAIAALTRSLLDPNLFVRWASARTLGNLASTRKADDAVPVLMRLLNDREDLGVRVAAAGALEKFGPAAKAAVPRLAWAVNRGDREYRIAVLHALQGIGTDAAPALPNVAWILRNDDTPTVRVEAAHTLGLFGKLAKGQEGALREAMLRDPDETVRQAAGDALLSVAPSAK
jgi:HEAT repeat protein